MGVSGGGGGRESRIQVRHRIVRMSLFISTTEMCRMLRVNGQSFCRGLRISLFGLTTVLCRMLSVNYQNLSRGLHMERCRQVTASARL